MVLPAQLGLFAAPLPECRVAAGDRLDFLRALPDGAARLVVTSAIVNTSSAPVVLTARECLFQQADVETTAQLDRFEPLVSCSAVSSTRTLAPGESSSSLEVEFGVRSGPGDYSLKLRHALSPEFRGEVSFRVQ